MSETHFGFSKVDSEEKASKVAGVFHSVASKYDVMNDVLSVGMHRAWKAFTVNRAAVRLGMRVLDIAGGTGDLALAFSKQVVRKVRSGLPTLTDRCWHWVATGFWMLQLHNQLLSAMASTYHFLIIISTV